MDNDDFLKYCQGAYAQELDEVDGLYRRCGLLLTADVALATGVLALGRTDVLPMLGVRFDVSVYYLAIATSLVLLFAAAYELIRALQPAEYERVQTPDKWAEWREELRLRIRASGEHDEDRIEVIVGRETNKELSRMLGKAVSQSFQTNRTRLGTFERSFRRSAWVVPLLAVEAAVLFWMTTNGVVPHARSDQHTDRQSAAPITSTADPATASRKRDGE